MAVVSCTLSGSMSGFDTGLEKENLVIFVFGKKIRMGLPIMVVYMYMFDGIYVVQC